MKKSYLIGAGMLITQLTFSQKSAVTEGILSLRKGDLAEAKAMLDKAVGHEDTKEDAKAWFNRGTVYMQLMMTQDPKYKGLVSEEEGMNAFVDSYKNAYEFDTKKQYRSDIKTQIGFVNAQISNQAYTYYKLGDSLQSKTHFDTAFMMYASIDELSQVVKKNDTSMIYNAASCGQRAENIDGAIEYFEKYKQAGGLKPVPSSTDLKMSKVKQLLEEGKTSEAEQILKEEVEKDPTNSQVRFAIGVVYDNLKDFEKAKEAYSKAVELDANNHNALFNLGLLYSNTASDINSKMNDLPLDAQAEYNKLKTQRDELLKSGLPYLEKAYAKDGDSQLKSVLNQSYNALGMTEKIIK